MSWEPLTAEGFDDLVGPLAGLEISLPWKGAGTAIFLELGTITPPADPRRGRKGEATLAIEWDWRLEAISEVICGSADSRPDIVAGISLLKGVVIESIDVSGPIPDLLMDLSNGQRLRTMTVLSGDPQWSIRIPDGRRIRPLAGALSVGDGSEVQEITGEVEAAMIAAENAAARWGRPSLEPAPGRCSACTSFVRLDGEFELLDYGCCTAAGGPFDGRAVHVRSACPSFSTGAGDAGTLA